MVRKGISSQSLLYKIFHALLFIWRKSVWIWQQSLWESNQHGKLHPWVTLSPRWREPDLSHPTVLSVLHRIREGWRRRLEKGGEIAQKLIIQSFSTESMTHLRHVLLVKGERDVGTAVVLVREAGVAFGGWRGCRGQHSPRLGQGLTKQCSSLSGNTGIGLQDTTSGLYCPTWFWSTPHLKKKEEPKIGIFYCIREVLVNALEYDAAAANLPWCNESFHFDTGKCCSLPPIWHHQQLLVR